MKHFLQSAGWAKFQESQGHQVINKDGMYAYRRLMKFGFTQLYIPHLDLTEKQWGDWRDIAEDLSVDFVRYEPNTYDGILPGFRRVKDFQPSHTLILNLRQTEEELLNQLHSKTRYNINLAAKRGVTCRVGDKAEFEKFWKLISSTYSRKDIYTHSREYYQNLLDINPDAYLVFAEYDNTVIVANLMIRFADTVTYVHGGSHNDYRNLMAPHLLQWFEILRGKTDGFHNYDFWGIAPTDDEMHPWAGITRFKKGFGGTVITYPGTLEKGMSWTYPLYRLLSMLR